MRICGRLGLPNLALLDQEQPPQQPRSSSDVVQQYRSGLENAASSSEQRPCVEAQQAEVQEQAEVLYTDRLLRKRKQVDYKEGGRKKPKDEVSKAAVQKSVNLIASAENDDEFMCFEPDGKPFVFVKSASLVDLDGCYCTIDDIVDGSHVFLRGEMSFTKEPWEEAMIKGAGRMVEWFGDRIGSDNPAFGVADAQTNFILIEPTPEYEDFFKHMQAAAEFASLVAKNLSAGLDLSIFDTFSSFQDTCPEGSKPQALKSESAFKDFLLNNVERIVLMLKGWAKASGFGNAVSSTTILRSLESMGSFLPQRLVIYALEEHKQVYSSRVNKVAMQVQKKEQNKKLNYEFHTIREASFAKVGFSSKIFGIRDKSTGSNECTKEVELETRDQVRFRICQDDFVILNADQGNFIGQVQFFNLRKKTAHVIQFLPGTFTNLGAQHASRREHFQIMECGEVPLQSIFQKMNVSLEYSKTGAYSRLNFSFEDGSFESIWKPNYEQYKCRCCEYKKLKCSDAECKKEGPEQVLLKGDLFTKGSFLLLKSDMTDGKNWLKLEQPQTKYSKKYLEQRPELKSHTERKKGKKHPRRIPLPQQLAQVKSLKRDRSGKTNALLLLFDRPKELDAHPHLVLPTRRTIQVDLNGDTVASKAYACNMSDFADGDINKWLLEGPNRFFYNQPYRVIELEASNIEANVPPLWPSLRSGVDKLRTLDVFCGAGGFSWGLRESGVAEICWGLDCDDQSAQAFSLNFPEAQTYLCDASTFTKDLLMNATCDRNGNEYPKKGSVDLICAGTPCQGYSGLNRHKNTESSADKRSHSKTLLSIVDKLRPKYVVWENVANVATHWDGKFMKFFIRCLVDFGYQCRYGVLQAANFGVAQSRQRVILIAAKQGLTLPKLPAPTHCTSGKCSNFNVFGEENEAQNCGAPLREIISKDILADLPDKAGEPIYKTPPLNPIQRKLREDSPNVRLHIAKTSPLMSKRIEYIPRGGNWMHLPNISVELEDGSWTEELTYFPYTLVDGSETSVVCPCLVGLKCLFLKSHPKNTILPFSCAHTSERNGNWMTCCARVGMDEPFATTTTIIHCFRKQGKVIHPSANRLLTIREISRSQGLPDNFQVLGTLDEMSTQVGNAVPPPLAFHVGLEILKSMNKV